MYLTAHYVRSPQRRTGINAFLYEHDGGPAESISWRAIDLDYVSQVACGRLVAERIEIAPGGNRVLAFLDLAAPDGTTLEEIRAAIDAALPLVAAGDEVELQPHSVALRFRAPGLTPRNQAGVLQSLGGAATHLYESPVPPSLPLEPITIVACADGRRVTLVLSEESRSAVMSVAGREEQPQSISIDDAVLESFLDLHGSILPHLLPVVTGLPLEQIVAAGGISVVDGSGNLVLRWPAT